MARKIQAAVLHGREDVRIEQVDVGDPGPGEVLLRIEAALTCGTDAKVFRRGHHARMIVPPAVFGHEAAGVIEALGDGVTGFRPGDPVVVANSAPCGSCEYCRVGRANLCEDLLFWNGAYAGLALIPARIVSANLLQRPPSVAAHEAALVEPLACAVHSLDQCVIRSGDRIAILGAGPLGLMLLILARNMGAEVIVAGRSPEGLARAAALGASAVVSAHQGDLGGQLRAVSPDGRGFTLVIEAVGRAETTEAALAAVRRGGQVNLFGGCEAGTTVPLDVVQWHYQEIRGFGTFHHTPESVRRALRLIEDRTVNPGMFIEGEAKLEALPTILREMAEGKRQLKTVVRP